MTVKYFKLLGYRFLSTKIWNFLDFVLILEMHYIINSCKNMCKIYGNNDAKSCNTWSFPSYREEEIHTKLADMFDRFAEL